MFKAAIVVPVILAFRSFIKTHQDRKVAKKAADPATPINIRAEAPLMTGAIRRAQEHIGRFSPHSRAGRPPNKERKLIDEGFVRSA